MKISTYRTPFYHRRQQFAVDPTDSRFRSKPGLGRSWLSFISQSSQLAIGPAGTGLLSRLLSSWLLAIALSTAAFAQPANDLCTNATPVSFGVQVNGTSVGATSTGDPLHCTGAQGRAVWYTVVGNGSTLTASTCPGATFDTEIGIFQGSCNALSQITCSDDFCGLQSQVSWASTAGTLYYIMVDGFSGGTGNFSLRVTSPGCTSPDVPTVSATKNSICSGETVTLSIQSGNLNSATSWHWYSGSCGGTPVNTGTSIQVSPTASTTYYVRGEGGCVSPGSCASVSITVNPKPVVTVTNPAPVCSPNTVNLNSAVSVDVTGSSLAFYTDQGASTTLTNPTAVSVTGTYYVRATSGTGCVSDIKPISVTVNPRPTPAITGLASAYCKDAPAVTLTGSPGAGAFTIDGSAATSFNPTSLSVGAHTVVFSYTNANGCSNTASQSVTVNALPTPAITGLASAYCKDAPAVTLTGSPGAGAFTIDGSAATSFNPAILSVGAHTVVFSYTNANGCSNSTSQPVTVNALPTPSLSNNGPLSDINPVTLTASGGATYAFSSGASQINPPTGNTASITTPGLYSVTASSPQGCTATASTTVTGAVSPVVCRGSDAVLTVLASGSGLTYQWYKNGQTAANKMTEIASIQRGTTTSSLTLVNNQTTANYYVKVTDGSSNVVWYGPIKVTVNFNCSGRIGAELSAEEVPLEVVLLSNPMTDSHLRALIKGAEGQALRVQLFNLRGLPVQTQQWSSAARVESMDWDVSSQGPGQYVLRALSTSLQGSEKIHTVKIIKPN